MQTVGVTRALLSKTLADDEFQSLCFQLGLELDEAEKTMITKEQGAERSCGPSEEIVHRIDVPPDLYDPPCLEGLVTGLQIFQENLNKLGNISSVRFSDVTLHQASCNSFIDLQDKLHQNICGKRSLLTIGTHNPDTVAAPFAYDAEAPSDIRFKPLNWEKEYRGSEIMELYARVNMDRDGDGEMEERRSIRDSSRKLKKYGSTSKHMTRNENLVKHIVSKTDTLQGIALKYGVTTEQIRRINRLWASDSLFLREHLLVPVSTDPTSSSNVADAAPSATDTDIALSNALASTPVVSPNDDGASISDFLAKMDSSIETVKNQVKRVQGSSEFCWDSDTTHVQRRKATARLRNSHPVTSSSISDTSSSEQLRPLSTNDVHSLPSAVVMTQGRRIKTSLQKLQQQQDEIFQL